MTLLSGFVKQVWWWRWLEIVLGSHELAAVIQFGDTYTYGEAWRVRLMGAIAKAVSERGEAITRALQQHRLSTPPMLLLPDTAINKVFSTRPKKTAKQIRGMKQLVPKLSKFLSMVMPLAVYDQIISRVMTEAEQLDWSAQMEVVATDYQKLTQVIEAWLSLVKKRCGLTYSEMIAQVREEVISEMCTFITNSVDEYTYLSKTQLGKRYQKLLETQDVGGVVKGYVGY